MVIKSPPDLSCGVESWHSVTLKPWGLFSWGLLPSTTAFLGGAVVRNPPAMGGRPEFDLPSMGNYPGGGNSNSLQYPSEIPWTEEPGGLWSMGSQRVGHSWVAEHCHCHSTTFQGTEGSLDDLESLNWVLKVQRVTKAGWVRGLSSSAKNHLIRGLSPELDVSLPVYGHHVQRAAVRGQRSWGWSQQETWLEQGQDRRFCDWRAAVS